MLDCGTTERAGEGKRHGTGSVTKSGRSEKSSVGGNKLLMSLSDSGREGEKKSQTERNGNIWSLTSHYSVKYLHTQLFSTQASRD